MTRILHWLPADFLEWDGFGPMWRNLIAWLAEGTAG